MHSVMPPEDNSSAPPASALEHAQTISAASPSSQDYVQAQNTDGGDTARGPDSAGDASGSGDIKSGTDSTIKGGNEGINLATLFSNAATKEMLQRQVNATVVSIASRKEPPRMAKWLEHFEARSHLVVFRVLHLLVSEAANFCSLDFLSCACVHTRATAGQNTTLNTHIRAHTHSHTLSHDM